MIVILYSGKSMNDVLMYEKCVRLKIVYYIYK